MKSSNPRQSGRLEAQEIADRPPWAIRNEQEEAALLERCHSYILASPHSPGGGCEDVLYFTRCERWLRIASRVAYHGRTDAGSGEICANINTYKTEDLFLKYWGSVPPELSRLPLPRNLRELEERGDVPAQPGSGEFIGFAEEMIERNSLLPVLRSWAEDWPHPIDPPLMLGPMSDDPGAEIEAVGEFLNPCEKDILRFLVHHTARMTRDVIFEEMGSQGFLHGKSTVFNGLSRLKKMFYLS